MLYSHGTSISKHQYKNIMYKHVYMQNTIYKIQIYQNIFSVQSRRNKWRGGGGAIAHIYFANQNLKAQITRDNPV